MHQYSEKQLDEMDSLLAEIMNTRLRLTRKDNKYYESHKSSSDSSSSENESEQTESLYDPPLLPKVV